MGRISSSLEDRRMWGRALKSYKGAFGTGSIDDEPERDGRLWGCIPIDKSVLKGVGDVFALNKSDPSSAWHQIDDFNEFQLALDAMKVSRMLIGHYWTCRVSFYFKRDRDKLKVGDRDIVEVAGVRWFGDDSIPDLFLTVDRLLHRAEAPPPLPEFAKKQLS